MKEYHGYGETLVSTQVRCKVKAVQSRAFCYFDIAYIINITSVLIFIVPSGEVKGEENKEG